MKIKGLFHIHSSYSHDSEFSLSGIKECLIRMGCGFGVICDHQKDFDQGKYAALREDCEHGSGDDFRLIPGLEFEFNTVHILGVGLQEYFKPNTIAACLEKIKARKGLAIWAHPAGKDLDDMRPYLGLLDGMEVWSARYGTKYAPAVRLCDLVNRQQLKGNNIRAFAGQDAHRADQIKDLWIEVESNSLSEEDILQQLMAGKFDLVFRSFRIPATGRLSLWQRILFPVLYNSYQLAEKAIDGVGAKRKEHSAEQEA